MGGGEMTTQMASVCAYNYTGPDSTIEAMRGAIRHRAAEEGYTIDERSLRDAMETLASDGNPGYDFWCNFGVRTTSGALLHMSICNYDDTTRCVCLDVIPNSGLRQWRERREKDEQPASEPVSSGGAPIALIVAVAVVVVWMVMLWR